MQRKRAVFLILLLLGVSLVLGGWWYTKEKKQFVTYLTMAIERGSLSRIVTATGTVNPVTTVEVGSYTSGPIKELFVDFNSQVKKGQRVAPRSTHDHLSSRLSKPKQFLRPRALKLTKTRQTSILSDRCSNGCVNCPSVT